MGALVYGIFIFAMLPRGIVALDDDFGYLRSVVLTLQHGRPWTDEWLEPWSAGWSLLCAGAYRLTGSFYLATYGMLAVLGGAAFYFLFRLARSRGLGFASSGAVAALGLTFPTLLWKSVQFTGMGLYIPALLGALLFAENQNCLGFAILWYLAVTTRQSAILWGALPGFVLLRELFRARWTGVLTLKLIGVILGGLAVYLSFGRLMNHTHAQALTTDHMWAQWSWGQAWTSIVVGGGLSLWAVGLIGMLTLVHSGPDVFRSKAKFIVRLLLAALVLSFLRVGPHDHVAFDHAAFDETPGQVYLKALTLLSAMGLLFGRFSFNILPCAGMLGAWIGLTLRGAIWDYYVIDLVVFAAFAFWPKFPLAESRRATLAARLRIGVAIAAFMLPLHLFFLGHFKHRLDRGYALCNLAARALEENRLQPDQLSFISFGLGGWYFFPYYVTHEGAGSADVGDFGRYVKQDAVDLAWRYAKPLRWIPDHDGSLPLDRRRVTIGGRYSYFWIFTQDFLLLTPPNSRVKPAKSPLPAGFRPPVFPETDAEWSELIQGTLIKA